MSHDKSQNMLDKTNGTESKKDGNQSMHDEPTQRLDVLDPMVNVD